MPGTLLTQAIGRVRTRRLTLRTAAGVAATGFTLADTLTCVIFAGDDRAPLASPTADWIDPDDCTARVIYLASDTVGFTPGTYLQDLNVLRAGQLIHADRARLRLYAVAGEGEDVGPAFYNSMGEIEALASGWVNDLLNLDVDQTGFAEQLHLARQWLDRQVLARRRRDLDDWYRWRALDPIAVDIEADLVALQDYLDDDRLLIDSPLDAGMARRICGHYALQLICAPQIGNLGETSYQMLAARHGAMAVRMLAGWSARIDTSDPADGGADMVLCP